MRRRVSIDETPRRRANPGGQAQFVDDWTHRYVALEGGWGAGKSYAGAGKLVTLHAHNAFDDAGQPTFVPSAVIAPTFPNAMDFDVPAIQAALDDAGIPHRWRASGSVSRGKYAAPAIVIDAFGTAANPSVILVRTAEAPDRITGWEVGAYWGDEAARWPEDKLNPKRDPGIQIRGRLRHPRARFLQGLYTYTNEGDHTRVYEDFHEGRPDHALYRASTHENPVVAGFLASIQTSLTEEMRLQYIDGGAASLRGKAVYRYFDAARNVDEAVAFDRALPAHLCFDFNISPGMHVLIGQEWPARDLLTVTHEIHGPGMDVREAMVVAITMLRELCGPKVGEIQLFGDATGQSRWAGTGESCWGIVRQALTAANIPFRFRVPGENPPVSDRVNAFNLALCDGTGRGHWKCHPRCKRLIEDLRKLRFDERGEVNKKERHLSHPSDAEGYRVHFIRPVRVTSAAASGGRFGV